MFAPPATRPHCLGAIGAQQEMTFYVRLLVHIVAPSVVTIVLPSAVPSVVHSVVPITVPSVVSYCDLIIFVQYHIDLIIFVQYHIVT